MSWMDRRFAARSRAQYPSMAMTETQMIASLEHSGHHKEALQAIYKKWRKKLCHLHEYWPGDLSPFQSAQVARAYILFRAHKPGTQRRDTTGSSYVLQSASAEVDTLPKDFRKRILIQSCGTNRPSKVRAMLLSHKLTEQEYFILLTRQKKTSYSSYHEIESAFRSPHTPAWLRLAMCLEPKRSGQYWFKYLTPSLPDLQYAYFNPTGSDTGIAWMEAYSATQARYFRRLLREEGWDLPRRFARQSIEPLIRSNHPIRMLRRWAKEWKPN